MKLAVEQDPAIVGVSSAWVICSSSWWSCTQSLVGQERGSEVSGARFECCSADVKDLGDVAMLEADHDRRAVRRKLYEPFGLEGAQCLTHGCTADPKLIGQGVLIQTGPGAIRPRKISVTEVVLHDPLHGPIGGQGVAFGRGKPADVLDVRREIHK